MSFSLRQRNRNNRNPFVGIIFGIGLFFGSFVLLYLNEGRVDLSKIADDSISVNSETVDIANQEKLIAVSGILHSDDPIGDPELLTTNDYLQLERSAEMYAWSEDVDEDEDTGTKSYSYSKGWESNPENSQNFNNSNGHFNPPMKYRDEEFTASTLTLGQYSANPNSLFFMKKESLQLTEGMLLDGRVAEDYIFIGKGTLNDPEVGDLRVSYKAFVNDQQVTLFGEQYENQIRPFSHKDTILYRVYPSDRETAIASMRTEFLTLLWSFRVGGLFMMWFGLLAIVSPLTRLLGYVPLVGEAGRFLISAMAFGIAFVLSLTTVIISAIIHSPIALLTIMVLTIAGAVFLWRRRDVGKETAVFP